MIERKNIGWCGTPPITYGNYDGNWQEQESILNINTSYWGGSASYQWGVISDNNQLVVLRITEEYEQP